MSIDVLKLTESQKPYLQAIKWLLSGISHDRTGRSHLMAYVFISEALEYSGKRIHIFDHYPGRVASEHLMTKIKILVYEMSLAHPFSDQKAYRERFTFYDTSFIYLKKGGEQRLMRSGNIYQPIRKGE